MSNLVCHPFKPIYDKNSKILILGTFPSVKSRAADIYYGNPQNRFWKVLSIVLNLPFPQTREDKIKFLSDNHIAVWDVIASCIIDNSDDSSIKNPVPNDFSIIFNRANISQVFTTGKKATELYARFTGNQSVYLPSSSGANCAVSMQKLIDSYSIIKKYLF